MLPRVDVDIGRPQKQSIAADASRDAHLLHLVLDAFEARAALQKVFRLPQ